MIQVSIQMLNDSKVDLDEKFLPSHSASPFSCVFLTNFLCTCTGIRIRIVSSLYFHLLTYLIDALFNTPMNL